MNSAIAPDSGVRHPPRGARSAGSGLFRPAIAWLVLFATICASSFAQDKAPSKTEVVVARSPRTVVVDGSLEEWDSGRGITLDSADHCLPLTGPAFWNGPGDCSGTLHLAWDDQFLHLAGRITDDSLVLHPGRLFLGDAIEVFLRVDDEEGRGDYQWILSPLSPTLRWTLERSRDRRGVSDGGMDGVLVEGREVRDADGAYRGYTFEAAIPLANFPGFDPSTTRTMGANLAIVDADGGPGQKTYLLWAGTRGPAEDPSALGTLRFVGERSPVVMPPATDAVSPWKFPAAVLASIAALLALAWVLRRPLRRVSDLSLLRRFGIVTALGAALVAVRWLPTQREQAAREDREARLLEARDLIEAVAAEAVEARVLEAGREEPLSPLLALAAGERLAPLPSFAWSLVPAASAPERRTVERGTPVLRTNVNLEAEATAVFRPPSRIEVAALSLVLSWERSGDEDSQGPAFGVPVGRVVALLADGTAEPLDLRFGREVDDSHITDESGHRADQATVAWTERDAAAPPDTAGLRHADEVLWTLPAPRPLAALEFEQVLPGGRLVLHAVSLLPAGESTAVPLPLGRRSLEGVPTGSWNGQPADGSVEIGPESRRWERALDEDADLVHVFYASRGHAPERAGAEVCSVHLRLDDGSETAAVLLRNGENLDAERLPGRDHPPDATSRMATRWLDDEGAMRHRDVLTIEVPEGRRPAALVLDYVGESTRLVIDGITLARRRRAAAPTGLRLLRRVDDRYLLDGDAAARLAAFALSHYRGDRAVASTLPAQTRDRLLGTERPAVDPAAPYERLLGGGRYTARQVALPFRDGNEVIEVLSPVADTDAGLAPWILAATALLSLLLLPVAVSVVVDMLGLLPHLRWKLAGAFGLAAVLPLVMLTLVLVRSFEERVEGDLASEIESIGASADRALHARVERARRVAANLAADTALTRALSLGGSDERSAALDTLVREHAAAEGGGTSVALETVRRSGGRRERATYPLRAVPAALQGVYEPENGLHYRWSRIVATGVDVLRTEDTQATVIVEIPVDEEDLGRVRAAGAGRAHLRLFSPDGYPVASTIDLPGSGTPDQVAARRSLADELLRDPGRLRLRREFLAGIEHEVGWEPVRDGDRTVALLATAIPRRPLQAATLGTRDLLLLLGAGALLLALLVANVVTHRLAEPVTSLARVARRVEEGDLDVRATRTTGDELGALADAFNSMTGQLRGRIDELSRLNAHLGDLVGTLERPRVLALTVETFRDAADPDGLLVVVVDEDGAGIEVAAGLRFGKALQPVALPSAGRITRLLEGEHAGTAALPPLTEGAGDGEADLLAGFRSCTALPFSAGGGRTRGGVLLLHAVPRADDGAGRLDFLAALAHQAAIALENARLYRLAVEDPETGLYGPTYFRKRLQEEIDRGLDAEKPVSLVIAAFEGLDAVTRDGGQDAAVGLLRRAVAAMHSTLRAMHIAARWDREEIAVLLPDTPRGRAEEIAARLQSAVAAVPTDGELPPLRLSVGVATAPEDAGSAAFLEDAASRGLRRARDRRGAAEGPAAFGTLPGVDRAEAEAMGFRSEKSLLMLDALNRIATSDVPVLVMGETGAGKEIVADIIHEKSRRSGGPLVKVNCAALPGPLLESELFGYERGAFTGAERRHAGRFEQAHGGTLFLDEIGEMPTALQVKLLRVLQDGRVQRLGGTAAVDVDVRIIAATNRDLPALIDAGQFREDLYFRLNVLSVVVPPLRARREDIPLLAERFLRQASMAHGGGTRQFTPEALDALHRHAFPGNVRELRNMVERAVVGATGDRITPGDLTFGAAARTTVRRSPAPVPLPRPAPAAVDAPARPSAAATPASTGAAEAHLSSRARRLLALLRKRGSLTNPEWSRTAGVSTRTGLRDFDELMDAGLVTREGKRRGARYMAVEDR